MAIGRRGFLGRLLAVPGAVMAGLAVQRRWNTGWIEPSEPSKMDLFYFKVRIDPGHVAIVQLGADGEAKTTVAPYRPSGWQAEPAYRLRLE